MKVLELQATQYLDLTVEKYYQAHNLDAFEGNRSQELFMVT